MRRHNLLAHLSVCVVVLVAMSFCAPVRAELIYATSGNDLAKFDSNSPGVVTSVPITELQTGESLVGIEVRPADQLLYGVGNARRMYTINPLTGVATHIGLTNGFSLSGTSFGVDINPVVDRLRIVSNTGQNVRVNPGTGDNAGTDTGITPAGAAIVGIAYSNNAAGSALTTLYGIDSANGVLGTIGSVNGTPISPNTGAFATVGSMGLGTSLDPRIGFDISGLGGIAYASILTGGSDKLYTIDLTTGAATLKGQIGNGQIVYSGLTAGIAPEPGSAGLLLIVGGALLSRRKLRV